MKERISILLCAFFFPLMVKAQLLQLKDASTSDPISEVVVYAADGQLYRQTDASGELSLEAFVNEDSLFFQHPAYQDL